MAVHQMSAAVLAGGTRLESSHGFDREHSYGYDLLQPLFAEVMLVSPDPSADLIWPGLVVQADGMPHAPLTVIHKALLVAQFDQLLVIDAVSPACSADLLDRSAAMAEQRWDVMAVRPQPDALPIPLVFHRRCEKLIRQYLTKPPNDMDGFMRRVRSHTIDLNQDK